MIPWQCLIFISQHSVLAGWAQGKEANFLLPMCVATLDLVVAAARRQRTSGGGLQRTAEVAKVIKRHALHSY